MAHTTVSDRGRSETNPTLPVTDLGPLLADIERTAGERGLVIVPATPDTANMPTVQYPGDWQTYIDLAARAGTTILYVAANQHDPEAEITYLLSAEGDRERQRADRSGLGVLEELVQRDHEQRRTRLAAEQAADEEAKATAGWSSLGGLIAPDVLTEPDELQEPADSVLGSDDSEAWLTQRLREAAQPWDAYAGMVKWISCVWFRDGVAHHWDVGTDWNDAFLSAMIDARTAADATQDDHQIMRTREAAIRFHQLATDLAHHPDASPRDAGSSAILILT
jgi:hypothetical protein